MKGQTLINNEDFKTLILKEKELEDLKKELENKKTNNTYEQFEKIYLKNIYEQEKYHIRNLLEKDLKENIMSDYHYNQLQTAFLNDGIKDLNYINEQILKLRDRYLEENKED